MITLQWRWSESEVQNKSLLSTPTLCRKVRNKAAVEVGTQAKVGTQVEVAGVNVKTVVKF